MLIGALRSALLGALALVLLVVGVVAVVLTVRERRDDEAGQRMRGVAASIYPPVGATAYAGVAEGCPTSEYVFCARTQLDADVAAGQMQASLTRAARRPAALSCYTVRSRLRVRSCEVRIDDHGHAVLIEVDTAELRRGGDLVTSGSTVRVQVD